MAAEPLPCIVNKNEKEEVEEEEEDKKSNYHDCTTTFYKINSIENYKDDNMDNEEQVEKNESTAAIEFDKPFILIMEKFDQDAELKICENIIEEKEPTIKITKVSFSEIDQIFAENEAAVKSFTKFLNCNPEYLILNDEDFEDLFSLYWIRKLENSENDESEEVDITDDNVHEEFDIYETPTLDDISDQLKSMYKLSENNYNMENYVNYLKEKSSENVIDREEISIGYVQSAEAVEEMGEVTSLLGGKTYFNKYYYCEVNIF